MLFVCFRVFMCVGMIVVCMYLCLYACMFVCFICVFIVCIYRCMQCIYLRDPGRDRVSINYKSNKRITCISPSKTFSALHNSSPLNNMAAGISPLLKIAVGKPLLLWRPAEWNFGTNWGLKFLNRRLEKCRFKNLKGIFPEDRVWGFGLKANDSLLNITCVPLNLFDH